MQIWLLICSSDHRYSQKNRTMAASRYSFRLYHNGCNAIPSQEEKARVGFTHKHHNVSAEKYKKCNHHQRYQPGFTIESIGLIISRGQRSSLRVLLCFPVLNIKANIAEDLIDVLSSRVNRCFCICPHFRRKSNQGQPRPDASASHYLRRE